MPSLREKMAEHGFESNDDYEYHVQCLLNSPVDGIRCLDVQGDSDRRKTAFATALAHALEYPHVLYHDFTQQHDPPPKAAPPKLPDEEGGGQEQPIPQLDRVVSEACAYSEAEKTILILDQLQAADFREHIRIYRFVTSTEWPYRLATAQANRRNLLLFLISEQPLYHSLQKTSFRVWTDTASGRPVDYRPEDFGLGSDARPLMERLAELFQALGVTPTQSEYAKILHDVHYNIRTEQHLRYSIFGWTEGVERELLFAKELEPLVQAAMQAIERYLGFDEIELGGGLSAL